ncbi:MAG: hypothetical protein CK540_00525 [Thermoleophilia bacterium]|nr:MAG: hypothetical protein CK540_00525 [Thermoleophilia bacterium]
MAPIRQVAPGGNVEFEVDAASQHAAWRVAGKRASVTRARAVAGDEAVDRILRDVIAQLRDTAVTAGEDSAALRSFAATIWAGRGGGAATVASDQSNRLF